MAEVEPVRDMADVKRMYQWLNEHSTAREAECFLIGCNLALRAGDLLSLPFSKIDGKTHIELNEQKTGKHKRIPITPLVREAVERLKAFYASRNFNATYLFQATGGRGKYMNKPMGIKFLCYEFKRASRALEFPFNFNTHSMRKTWGYHAYEGGADILYIQALLNHSNQHVTLRYIGVTKSTIEKMYFDNTLAIA